MSRVSKVVRRRPQPNVLAATPNAAPVSSMTKVGARFPKPAEGALEMGSNLADLLGHVRQGFGMFGLTFHGDRRLAEGALAKIEKNFRELEGEVKRLRADLESVASVAAPEERAATPES